jgi:hypothetical protein
MFCFKAGSLLEELKAFILKFEKNQVVWESNTNGILDLDYRWIFLLSALIMR